MTNRWPLRRITVRYHYEHKSAPAGTGSVELTLECGHAEFRKRSAEPKRQARCWACYMDGLDRDQPERGQTSD